MIKGCSGISEELFNFVNTWEKEVKPHCNVTLRNEFLTHDGAKCETGTEV